MSDLKNWLESLNELNPNEVFELAHISFNTFLGANFCGILVLEDQIVSKYIKSLRSIPNYKQQILNDLSFNFNVPFNALR